MGRYESYLIWAWRAAVLAGLAAVWVEARDASDYASSASYAAEEAKQAAETASQEAENAAKEASDAYRWLRRQ